MWKRSGLHWVHSPESKVLTNLLPAPPARAHWHLPVPVPGANIVPTSRLLTYRSSHLISGTAIYLNYIERLPNQNKTMHVENTGATNLSDGVDFDAAPVNCFMDGWSSEVFFHILTILKICWHPFNNWPITLYDCNKCRANVRTKFLWCLIEQPINHNRISLKTSQVAKVGKTWHCSWTFPSHGSLRSPWLKPSGRRALDAALYMARLPRATASKNALFRSCLILLLHSVLFIP